MRLTASGSYAIKIIQGTPSSPTQAGPKKRCPTVVPLNFATSSPSLLAAIGKTFVDFARANGMRAARVLRVPPDEAISEPSFFSSSTF
jgi:hypothetical protein